MTRQPKSEPFDLWLTPFVCIVCLERDVSVTARKAWLDEFGRRIFYRRGDELLVFANLPRMALDLARSGHAGIVEFGVDGPMHEEAVLPTPDYDPNPPVH